MKLENILSFIKEIDKLKQIKRATLNINEKVNENSAEHSWHLAMAVMMFKDLTPHKIDLEKAIKLALIHDVVEIHAGDTIIYADQPDKFEEELAAAKKVFGLLGDGHEKWIDLWIEYEKRETPEAIYVNGLDRFLPTFSNFVNEGHSWVEHGIRYDQVVEKNKVKISESIPELWEYVDKNLKEAVKAGYLS